MKLELCYYGLVKVEGDKINILEISKDDKYLRAKSQKFLSDYMSNKGFHYVLDKTLRTEFKSYPNYSLVNDPSLSERTYVYRLDLETVTNKGWLYSTKTNNVMTNLEFFLDIIKVESFHVDTKENDYFNRSFSFVKDDRVRKVPKVNDGESLFANDIFTKDNCNKKIENKNSKEDNKYKEDIFSTEM
jgi:hypothetical protein